MRRLALVAMLAVTSLYASGQSAERHSCTLRVKLSKSAYGVDEPIKGTLIIENPEKRTVALAKPLLPTAWSVVHYFDRNGRREQRAWEGGRGRGSSHLGPPPRYAAKDYLFIKPGGTYEEPIDVAWYLRNQEESLAPGQYEIEFQYESPANESERDIPLIPYLITSNVLRVSINAR